MLAAAIGRAANPSLGGSTLVSSGTAQAARFSGVGRMGGCTAFLIRPAAAPANAPAHVVTAGHCIDLDSNNVILDRADTRTLVFRYLHDNGTPDRVSARARRIVYSTMKRIDVAVLELETSLDRLGAERISAYELSSDEIAAGEAVEWAGVPRNGIPADEMFLRTSGCTVSGRPDVIEWRWTWWEMLRNDCSDIRGGASGSPLFATATGRVIGVLTTGNAGAIEQSGEFRCWRDNPCEVVPGGFEYVPDTSYATPVTALARCFDASGAFSLSAAGCGLDPGRQPRVLEPNIAVRPGARWNAAISSTEARQFRYKVVREGDGDCRSEAGYGALLPIEAGTRITEALPAEQGRYHLCVVGEGAPVKFATLVHLRLDATPPPMPPEFVLRARGDGGFAFETRTRVPELAGMRVKLDVAASDMCAVNDGYRDIYPVPLAIGPEVQRLCLIAYDLAGNAQEPVSVDLRGPSIFPAGVVNAAGQHAGAIAPGAWMSIFGVNLTASGELPGVMLLDSAGARVADTARVCVRGTDQRAGARGRRRRPGNDHDRVGQPHDARRGTRRGISAGAVHTQRRTVWRRGSVCHHGGRDERTCLRLRRKRPVLTSRGVRDGRTGVRRRRAEATAGGVSQRRGVRTRGARSFGFGCGGRADCTRPRARHRAAARHPAGANCRVRTCLGSSVCMVALKAPAVRA